MGSLFSTGIRPAVDEFLLAKAREKRDYGPYWSASSAGYCMRKTIFEKLGVPHVEQEDDGRKQRVFQAGHIFHQFMQGITKEAGLSIASEVELQDEDLMVRGHFDDLVLVGLTEHGRELVEAGDAEAGRGQHLILYDYKTVNSRSFTWSKQNNGAMSYYHRLQLGTYMYMLRSGSYDPKGAATSGKDLTPKTPVEEARILKISKDDLRMEEQQLLWSQALWNDVRDYWTSLNHHWKAQTLPRCTCADHENGFLAKPQYNPFYYNNTPCSLEWYELCKKEGKLLV